MYFAQLEEGDELIMRLFSQFISHKTPQLPPKYGWDPVYLGGILSCDHPRLQGNAGRTLPPIAGHPFPDGLDPFQASENRTNYDTRSTRGFPSGPARGHGDVMGPWAGTGRPRGWFGTAGW